MKYILMMIGAVLVLAGVALAADISHTPLVPGSLTGSDRVPMGRPSSGAADGKGTAYTASMDQIKAYARFAFPDRYPP